MANDINLGKLRIDANEFLADQVSIKDSIDGTRESMKKLRMETNNLSDASEEQKREYVQLDAELSKLNKEYNANKRVMAQAGQEQKKNVSFTNKMANAYKLAAVQVLAAWQAVQGLINVSKAYVNGTLDFLKQQTRVATLLDISRKEAKALTTEIRGLAAAYDVEFNVVLKTANILSKEFGVSADEALTLVEKGLQRAADKDEFLEQLKEYPAQLKTVGLSAEEAIAVMIRLERAGAFSDKGIDSIKEAGLRLRELTPATESALNAIGLSSKTIQKELESGQKSLFEIQKEVSKRLSELPPQSKAVGTAIADAFGGPGEDAGLRMLTTLFEIDTNLENIEDKSSKVEKNQRELNKTLVDFKDIILGSSGEIEGVFSGIQQSIISILNYLINLRNEGGILMAAFSVITNALSLNFKTIFTALEIFLINPFASGVKIITAALRGEFGKIGDLTKEFIENEKADAIQLGNQWMDAGSDIVDAWKGYQGEIEKVTEETGDKLIDKVKEVSDMAVKSYRKQLDEIKALTLDDLENSQFKYSREIDMAIEAADLKKQINDQFYANVKAKRDQDIKDAETQAIKDKEFLKMKQETQQEFASRIIDLNGQILDSVLDNLENERNKVEENYNARIKYAEGDAETVKKLEDEKFNKLQEIDQKSAQAQKAAFDRDKALKLAAAAIDGAAFILKAGATFGPFGAVAASIVVGAQLAAMGAQQLPGGGTEDGYINAAQREQAIIDKLREEQLQAQLDFEERSRKEAEERARQEAIEQRTRERTEAALKLEELTQGLAGIDEFIADLEERKKDAKGSGKTRIQKEIDEAYERRAVVQSQVNELAQIIGNTVKESDIIQEQYNDTLNKLRGVRADYQRELKAATTEQQKQAVAAKYDPAIQRLRDILSTLESDLAAALAEESIQSVIGSAARFSEGGRVTGGIQGKDSVLSLLTPGEEVATTKATSWYPGMVEAANQHKLDKWIVNNSSFNDANLLKGINQLNSTLRSKKMHVNVITGGNRRADYLYRRYGYVPR